jgi:DNA-binding CsgD family transcriptional regulator
MDHPMRLALNDALWHRTLGTLIELLDRPNFWNVLIRYLHDSVEFDSWVVLRFSRQARPVVFAENPQPDGSADVLFVDYLSGFYLLDPFYIAAMDDPRAALVRLDDVAPDHFEFEDYYQRYFKLNIVADEVQFNVPLAGGEVLALSLGSRQRYGPSDIALLQGISPWLLALLRQRALIETRHETRSSSPSESASAQQTEATAAAKGLPARTPGGASLTARELEIMQLLLSGFSSKTISQKLCISPETVKAHRKNVYAKLGVKSHPALFAIFLQSQAPASGTAPTPIG